MPRGFFAFLALAAASFAQAQSYTAVSLGSLGGSSTSGSTAFHATATSINDAGTIAGYSYAANGSAYGFSYGNGTMTELDALNVGASPYGINSEGTIVGFYAPTGGSTYAFSYSNGTVTDLGTLGGNSSSANGINDAGTIVGYSTTANSLLHAFSYSNGTMTDLGTLGGSYSVANGINGAGTIVGYANTTGNVSSHAFSYSNGTMTDLGTLGGGSSTALAINGAGTIVGNSSVVGGSHAFSYSGGTMTDLGTLGGNYSNANSINSAGTIVGNADTASVVGGVQEAFIYSGGTMTDLNTLVSLPGVLLYDAVAINDLGQIVALGYSNGTSDSYSYLLTPTFTTVPGQPTAVSIAPGNGQATVSFSAPANTGGAAITGYTVTATPNSGSPVTATGASSPITVSGLTNGTAYAFTVAATNSVGTGPASPAVTATPATVPDAPTGVSAVVTGDEQVTVSFSAPANTGGATITGYTVTATPTSGSPVMAAGISSPIIVNGLAHGTTYGFTVTATNSAGTGPASSASVATLPTVPDAPTGVSAGPGNGKATVSFSAPANTGGAAITSYTVTATPTSGSPVTMTGTSSPITVNGLANGTAYEFTVAATNSIGTGAASSASEATPAADLPDAPTNVSAVAGPGYDSATVTFSAPANTGGAPITGYTVTATPDSGSPVTATGASTTIIVTGLTAGTTYTFTVAATTTAGTGASSPASAGITPADLPSITTQPADQAAMPGAMVTFAAAATGYPIPTYRWQLSTDGGATWNNLSDGSGISGSTTATLAIASASGSLDGYEYRCVATNNQGSINSDAATLTINPVSNPTFTVASGHSVVFNATATGTPATTYQWTLNGGPTIPGATGTTDHILLISGATSADDGTYVCTATNSQGSVTTTDTLNVVITAAPGYLTNISSRAVVGTGGNILIAGFGIAGSGSMDLLVRGGGPTLAAPPYNGTGYIAAPQLTLFDTLVPSSPQPIVTNVTWGGPFTLGTSRVNVSPQAATTALFDTVGAYHFNLGSADSALEVTPPAGNYTAQISGVNGVTGVVLAEIYDADGYNPAARLVNISTRAQVGTGANILIGGFVIGGTTAETLLIRAVGPTLTQPPYNGTGYITNPQLTLYAGSTPIYSNTGWGNDATISTAFGTVGAFALNPTSADSALLVTLPPASNYTAQVSGVNNGTGIALMEIYEVY